MTVALFEASVGTRQLAPFNVRPERTAGAGWSAWSDASARRAAGRGQEGWHPFTLNDQSSEPTYSLPPLAPGRPA